MDSFKKLKVVSGRENNLKNVDLELPHDNLTVVTGLSGSGKSSLAFDTIYAEGQRRYIETFSPYTRQFFDKVKKPDVDLIENVRPAIAIQQRTRVTSSRSTVGSMTNVNDYLKILWSNAAEAVCPRCDVKLEAWNSAMLYDHLLRLLALKPASTFLVCAAVDTPNAAAARQQRERLLQLGFGRVFNPEACAIESLEETQKPALWQGKKLLVALDRLKGAGVTEKRLRDSLDQAFGLGRGNCIVIEPRQDALRPFLAIANNEKQENVSRGAFNLREFRGTAGCPSNEIRIERARPSLFSFNHPMGACPECRGFGKILSVDPELCVPNPNLSIEKKALQCWAGDSARALHGRLLKFCESEGIPADRPWLELTAEQREAIFGHRSKKYVGVRHWFKRLEAKSYKMHVRVFMSRFRNQFDCPACGGTRLTPSALAYRLDGRSLPQIWQMPIDELEQWLQGIRSRLEAQAKLARDMADVFEAVLSRLRFLVDLGLPYLTLDRQARTLSGGETQRVNLAAALGSALVSTHFVLDEPSAGLHSRDTERLIRSIRELQEQGNSLLVVEHDLDCMAAADHILELGPLAGERGGEIVFNGERAAWPSFQVVLPEPASEDCRGGKSLSIRKASARNLSGFDLQIPLGRFVCLSGVSGSGKSTLVNEVIKRAYDQHRLRLAPSSGENLVSGFEHLDQLLLVDQAPLAKSPRANIGTYSKIWDRVRDLYSQSEEARALGFSRSAFSFNVDGGRCPACKGTGFIREDMQFLSDVYISCEVCLGKRFQAAVLEVKLKGLSVEQLLGTTIEHLRELYSDEPLIRETSESLCRLGLGHLTLGHPLSELSGGEAQRLKLVPFLQESGKGRSFLIFDEPTTGLHYHDIERLIDLLKDLAARGHTVLCVEHNLTLLAAADWIIDLGPEGGSGGGEVMLEGSVAKYLEDERSSSHTARYLRDYFSPRPRRSGRAPVRAEQRNASKLHIAGAREHNLKNLDVDIPLDRLVALTGVSGSGKSTIAKDIIYAEGQRRYLDCLSPYARQYIKELKKPEIDRIENIKPTICVYQHTFQPSRLSTIATMSEIYNFLRLLYAKTGVQYCPDHPDQAISPLSPEEIARRVKESRSDSLRILAPIVKLKKGFHKQIFERASSSEIGEVRVDGAFGTPASYSEGLDRRQPHSIEFTIARFNPARMALELIQEAVNQALSLGAGTLLVHSKEGETVYSLDRTCPICKTGFFKPDPEDLSFNSKRGMCPECQGAGCDEDGEACEECCGARINAIGRNLRLQGKNIHEACLSAPPDLKSFLLGMEFDSRHRAIAGPIFTELLAKIDMLSSLGLDYLSLSRDCSTLSGGELQRLRLGTAMGSPLTGVLYIFDEPSAGLHPLDNQKVIERLRDLDRRGNSVIMIEHDADSILASDHVIDIGPGGGSLGGEVMFNGPIGELASCQASATSRALFGASAAADSDPPPAPAGQLRVKAERVNNIRKLVLSLPLRRLVGVAGVSGSGKSSLVHGAICQTIEHGRGRGARAWKGDGCIVESDESIDRVLLVDQKPIGANSRSTPASYLGVWDQIRKLYAATSEAKARGWKDGFFSYNTGKGRCPECKGQGQMKLEMSFLPEAVTQCESCYGGRFSEEADSILYLGIPISEVLKLTFEQAKVRFANHRKIHQILSRACDLGLGYLTLGQSSASLSGGESQRLKLVTEINSRSTGHTLYVLDEPTTGLHKADVSKLLACLQELVQRGSSVIVIEHDADVLERCQHLIELGPGPGDAGGKVIFQGTVDEIKKSATPWGRLLREKGKTLSKPAKKSAREKPSAAASA